MMKSDEFRLQLSGISKSYGGRNVLRNVSLQIGPGEFDMVTGSSGCGKSTLLNVIGLTDGFEGNYILNGHRVKKHEYPGIRNRHIGFVFQLYYLLPGLNVKENILLPLMYADRKALKTDYRRRYRILMTALGIAHLQEKKIDVLSGGEKQRVSIARAMILEPDLLLADEPTGALDRNNTEEVMRIFRNYAAQGHSIIMVTHDMSLRRAASRTFTLKNGKLYETSQMVHLQP